MIYIEYKLLTCQYVVAGNGAIYDLVLGRGWVLWMNRDLRFQN